MAQKILLAQRTNRHVLKKIDSSYVYEAPHFGTFGTTQTDNTGLNNPTSIAVDTLNNVYICDSENARIVKLDSTLAYVSSVDVTPIVDLPYKRHKPYAIFFDSVSGDLYVVGVYRDLTLTILRMSTSLVISKANYNIYPCAKEKPFSICSGFSVGDFVISLGTKLVKVTETVDLTFTATTVVTNETITSTQDECIVREKKFNVAYKPIVPLSYTFRRRYTEAPTQVSAIMFQTLHFPLLDSPGANPDTEIVVYKNGVELDNDPLLDDPNDYIINQSTGEITLQKPVISTDVIRIRYRYQMIESVDYAFDFLTGKLLLTTGVSEDWNGKTDVIEADYTYMAQAVEQAITGISNATITGLLKHSNGDIYLTQNTLSDAGKVSRVNSSYINIGDTNKISKYVIGLAIGLDGSILIYDSSNQKVVRYSEVMNFVEDVYEDTSDVVATDAYDIWGLAEVNI
jgi:hypothetical protein